MNLIQKVSQPGPKTTVFDLAGEGCVPVRKLRLSGRIPEGVQQDILTHILQEGVSPELAPVALENALYFLDALAAHPGLTLSPSETVDAAWHRFILNTEAYLGYCEKYAGRVLHHRPTRSGQRSSTTPQQTFDTLVKLGYEVDARVWGRGDSGCGGDCGGGDCDGVHGSV